MVEMCKETNERQRKMKAQQKKAREARGNAGKCNDKPKKKR